MKYLDMENWPRKKHFEVYSQFDYPHTSLCANVDIAAFRPFVKELDCSFAVATLYVMAKVANCLPEFCYRIRGEQVIIHDVVHPSMTVLLEDETFSFCTIQYSQEFQRFRVNADEAIAYVKDNPVLEDEPGKDDLLFMTSIPWVSFTSMMHPIHLNPIDSVPRIAWGKFFPDGEGLKMPLSVQVHHALMDGLHVGRFYSQAQEILNRPQDFF